MKFIGAMFLTLLGVFLIVLILAIPTVASCNLTAWNTTELVISGTIMVLAGLGLIVLGILWGNQK